MTGFEIHAFICRGDNYGVLLHDALSGLTISIDAPDEAAIGEALAARAWRLTHILVTHHHGDHVEGIAGLRKHSDCAVIGPRRESHRIPLLTGVVDGGDVIAIGRHKVSVIDCPGHTAGHVAYRFADDGLLFTADTLFAMGCGRVFEGTMEEMHRSVTQFAQLPPETQVYFGHEYTEANGRFALSVEPGNAALQARMAEVLQRRSKGLLTVPTTIAAERATNPFLRCDSPEIRSRLGLMDASDAEVFAALRKAKNSFS